MRKSAFCICENKDADQLRGNREADQGLCFRYLDSKSLYFLNTKIEASSHILGGCTAWFVSDWSETPKTGFLTKRLILLIE